MEMVLATWIGMFDVMSEIEFRECVCSEIRNYFNDSVEVKINFVL